MPGKHNAGGCGCCDEEISCFDGDCVGTTLDSLILSGSDINNGCSPDDIDGTYALLTDSCADEISEFRSSCSGYYGDFSAVMDVGIQKIVGPTPYRVTVEIFAQYANPGPLDSWGETDLWIYESASCPSGTVTLTHDSNSSGGGGPDPGYVRPSTVQVVLA